ncbi:MAG: hypothetical protein V4732_07845 [Pseudomonadota bacterium]
MTSEKRKTSEILLHGFYGAFLGAIILISVQWWVGPINQMYVVFGALFGFLLGAIVGERAVDFLKDLFSWS